MQNKVLKIEQELVGRRRQEIPLRRCEIMDIDTGAVISGEARSKRWGEALLERLVEVASGQVRTKPGSN
jgi:altronate dehydratase